MSFNLLILGKGSRQLADKFNDCGGTRVRCAAADDEYEEDLLCLKSASRVVSRVLQGRVDAILLTCDVHCSKSTSMFFSMSETFKTNRERVFVCLMNCTMEDVALKAKESSWEMQAALMFFADRFVSASDGPGNTLKALLKRKVRGAPIQMDILASDDFIRGAILRRNARKQLFTEAAQDAYARRVMEKRFRSKMDETMKVIMHDTRSTITI